MEKENDGSVGSEIVESMAVIKMEIDSARGAAMAHPRNVKASYDEALSELATFPKFADESFYSIPYKSKGEIVLVEGPSIGASTTLARCYGNCAAGSRVVAQDEERIKTQGVFIDYEKNVTFTNEVIVSRWGVKKNGERWLLNENKLVMAIQSGMSKAMRNATLKGLPKPYVQGYFLEAKRIAGGGKVNGEGQDLTPEQMVDKMFALFLKGYSISNDDLAEYISRVLPDDASKEDIAGHLKGVYNALKDGTITLANMFTESEVDIADPKRKSETTATDAEKKMLFAILDKSDKNEAQYKLYLNQKFGLKSRKDILASQVSAIKTWLETKEEEQTEFPT